jgi:hypothetical protein
MNNFSFFKKYTLLAVVLSLFRYGDLSAGLPAAVAPDAKKLLDMS